MKSIVNVGSKEKELPYPKLMNVIGKPQNIVFFTERNKGVVVSQGTWTSNYVGYYSPGWCASDFEDFIGSVTLSN